MRLVLVALACLVLAWLLWPEAEDGAPARTNGADPGPRAHPAPFLAAKGLERPPTKTVDREPEIVIWRPPPEDPIERGRCALTVDLVSTDTLDVVSPVVQLWRIREPASRDWTAGDRRVAWVRAKGGRCRFEQLAPGTYRVHAAGLRKGAEDPPAFPVSGAHTRQVLELDTPRLHPVRLRVYDETGRLLERGWKRLAGRGGPDERGGWPRWAKDRSLRSDGRTYHNVFLGVAFRGPRVVRRASEKRIPVTGGPWGVELARKPEPTREGTWLAQWEFHYGKHGRVEFYVGAAAGPLTLVAPALSREALADAVFLPDGRRAVDAGAAFEVVSPAALIDDESDPPDVRAMEMDIVVRLKGYRRLLESYRQCDPLPKSVMEKR